MINYEKAFSDLSKINQQRKSQHETYEKELSSFQKHMAEKKPQPDQFLSPEHYAHAINEWHKAYFMDAPNPPDYHTANND